MWLSIILFLQAYCVSELWVEGVLLSLVHNVRYAEVEWWLHCQKFQEGHQSVLPHSLKGADRSIHQGIRSTPLPIYQVSEIGPSIKATSVIVSIVKWGWYVPKCMLTTNRRQTTLFSNLVYFWHYIIPTVVKVHPWLNKSAWVGIQEICRKIYLWDCRSSHINDIALSSTVSQSEGIFEGYDRHFYKYQSSTARAVP